MKTYALEHFDTYIPVADLDDSILRKSLVPRNLPGPATLDNSSNGLLEENQKSSQILQDKFYQKM